METDLLPVMVTGFSSCKHKGKQEWQNQQAKRGKVLKQATHPDS